MDKKVYQGTLNEQGIEVLLGIQRNEQEYEKKLDSLKHQIMTIEKDYRKRVDVIEANADRYDQGKVADLLFDARKATRQRLQDLVDSKGWKEEIAKVTAELEAEYPQSEVQKLEQTMLEIEVRRLIVDEKIDPLILQGFVREGTPVFVQAVAKSPIPMGVEDAFLKEGIKRRKEVLQPELAAKYHSLLQVQSNFEGAASLSMPIKPGDNDPIKDHIDRDFEGKDE